jgi:hypothetical protein
MLSKLSSLGMGRCVCVGGGFLPSKVLTRQTYTLDMVGEGACFVGGGGGGRLAYAIRKASCPASHSTW